MPIEVHCAMCYNMLAATKRGEKSRFKVGCKIYRAVRLLKTV